MSSEEDPGENSPPAAGQCRVCRSPGRSRRGPPRCPLVWLRHKTHTQWWRCWNVSGCSVVSVFLRILCSQFSFQLQQLSSVLAVHCIYLKKIFNQAVYLVLGLHPAAIFCQAKSVFESWKGAIKMRFCTGTKLKICVCFFFCLYIFLCRMRVDPYRCLVAAPCRTAAGRTPAGWSNSLGDEGDQERREG